MIRLGVALIALLAAACSSVESGTITDKKWFDEYTTLIPIYIYAANGQVTGMYLEEIHTPSCWELYLRNGDDTGALCIDPNEWMRYAVGDQYP